MEFDYAAARKYLLELEACDRCIGRQFHRLFDGMDNGVIGSIVRQSVDLTEARDCQPDEVKLKEDCPLCNGYFLHTDELAESAIELIQNLDFDSFLVGARVKQALLGKEEEVWNEVGAMYCEPLKKDLVRQIGLAIFKSTGKDADFLKPDINVLADFPNKKTSIQIHPLFIYGKYKKLVRGIPQTKWFCTDCRGRGCKKCKFTGKMYDESVEEIIAKVLLDETGSSGEKFHGSGREDIDATMLGWRPFVLELQEPIIRLIDWTVMTKQINHYAEGKVEVQSLRKSTKDEVRYLKAVKHDKTYEAFVECEKSPSQENVEDLLKALTNVEICQQTPERVLHRRADLERKRLVNSVTLERVNDKKFRAVIKAAAGAYIKELISGDKGRTKPSFTDFLGPCKCVELNVLEVHENV